MLQAQNEFSPKHWKLVNPSLHMQVPVVSSQVQSPAVKSHCPFPLQGVSPPGQDISEIYEMFLNDLNLN